MLLTFDIPALARAVSQRWHQQERQGCIKMLLFKIQGYYLMREIKYMAEQIPHHCRQQHVLHILKLKEQLLKIQVM